MSEILFSYRTGRNSLENNRGPKTLILDLDETLVHSWHKPYFLETYKIYSDPQIYRQFHPKGQSQIAYSVILNDSDRIWGLHRPHLYDFLTFANEYFDNVIVWSAGISPYVEEISRQIFLEAGLTPPRLVWPRDRCSSLQDGRQQLFYHKPISKINDELASRLYPTFNIDPKTTLILDDKKHTFMENPNSGVLIPAYYPGKGKLNGPSLDDLLDRSDDALLKFMKWLERPEVRNAEDVRLLDKTKIFN